MGWWFLSVPILSKNIEASSKPRNFLPYDPVREKLTGNVLLLGARRPTRKRVNIVARRAPPFSIGSDFLHKPFHSNGLRRKAHLVSKIFFN